MVQKRKWLAGVRGDDPLSTAARPALEQRLELVRHYLMRVTDHRPEAEDVHQLRVSARRAEAVLHAFHEVTPPRRARWFLRKLKRIRKSANEARDLEVLRSRLHAQTPEPTPDGWKNLVRQIKSERDAALRPLVALGDKLRRRDFEAKIEKLVDRVAWRNEQRGEPDFAETARLRLAALAEPFFAAAMGDLQVIETLHAFRISGKRLRYAIEIFATLFPELRNRVYPRLEQLQQRLGEINDHAAALGRFAAWLAASEDLARNDLLQQQMLGEQAALAAALASFRSWWTLEQAVALQEAFRAALAQEQVAEVG